MIRDRNSLNVREENAASCIKYVILWTFLYSSTK